MTDRTCSGMLDSSPFFLWTIRYVDQQPQTVKGAGLRLEITLRGGQVRESYREMEPDPIDI